MGFSYMDILSSIKYIAYKIVKHGVIKSFRRLFDLNSTQSIPLYRLTISSPNKIYGIQYAPSPSNVVVEAIDRLSIAHSEYTFIDLGAGTGEAIKIASQYPFKRIVGVEFAEELVNIARANLHNCEQTEILLMDATLYDFPEGNLIIYMYNPFEANIMEKVMARINEAAKTRNIYIIYLQPNCRDMIEKYGARCISPEGWCMTFKVEAT